MIEPYRLRVDARTEPLAVDTPRPVLSWALRGAGHLGPVRVTAGEWSSGWLDGAVSSLEYSGPPLAASTRVTWRVEFRDGGAAESWFETAPEGWGDARWIGRDPEPASGIQSVDRDRILLVQPTQEAENLQPPLQLRRSFVVDGPVARARLHVSARGLVIPHLNGTRVGRDELFPGWSDYPTRIAYATQDVTDVLVVGENVLAAEVGDGWWSGYVGFDRRRQARHYGDAPQLIARLVVELADGGTLEVSTGEGWTEHPGRRRWADLLMGEHIDERFATPGWCSPGFDDTGWRAAIIVDDDRTMLRPEWTEPVREVGELTPTVVSREGDRVTLDFGQNIVGRVRLPEHDGLVVLRHGEMLDGDRLYTENLRSAQATDHLVGAREAAFTSHGFRYVEVTGAVDAEQIRAVVLSSDVEWTGGIRTGSELVNRIVSNVEWSQRGNFVSVPTDCPQRDERLGWTADTQVFAPTAALNADVQSLLGGWIDDLIATQRPSGSVPDVIPRPPGLDLFDYGAPGWGDAIVTVPWALYKAYGDARLLRRAFDPMRRWLDYVASRNPDGVWRAGRGNDYGDWLSVDEETPREVVATAYHARAARLAARIATVLGEDASALAERADLATAAFAAEFVAADRVHGDTQSAYLMALAWDLAPEDAREALFARLVEKLEERGIRLTTGFLGVALLTPTLERFGRADLAYDLLLQREYPSWGFSIDQGATTIWERWDGWTPERGFQTPAMNSFNHYSLGSVVQWVYEGVVGIRQAEDSAGWERVDIAPAIDARLGFAEGRLQTVRGEIAVRWDHADGVTALRVELPPGVTGVARLGGTEVVLGSGVTRLEG